MGGVDINDILRAEGADGVRKRHDNAQRFKKDSKALRFSVAPFNDMSNERDYQVKGLIPRKGLVIVWGPPKCGKSFWTFDLVMLIALGWEYRGRHVQQGTVVYLALEGSGGFRARIEAFRGATT